MTAQELRRELTVWQKLEHDNIVPFVGIALISELLPSIVSAWMPQGLTDPVLTMFHSNWLIAQELCVRI